MGCFHAAEDTTAIHRRRRQAAVAEGVGFEPTVGCPTLDFESSALNRTQPPFPVRVIVDLSWPRAIIRQSAEFAKVKHHASFAYELENRAPWFKPRDGVAVKIG